MLKFLEERARGLDFATPKNTDTAKTRDTAKFKDKGDVQLYHSQAATSCPKCSKHNGIFSCSDFHSLSVEERVQFVKNNKLCFNCLKIGHSSKECKSKSGCRMCKKRHNTLLHRPLASEKQEVSPQSCLGHGGYTSCSVTLLPTAVIKVRTVKDKLVSVRALLDSGSQVTCITSKCRKRLQLRQRQADIRVSGIGGTLSAKSGSIVGLQIIPLHQEEITTTSVVLGQVTRRLPSYQIEDKSLNAVKDLKWADPDFKTPGEIDIILGGDVYERIVGDEKRLITQDLFARNTASG